MSLLPDGPADHAHTPEEVRSYGRELIGHMCTVCHEMVRKCTCGVWHCRRSRFCSNTCTAKERKARQQNEARLGWKR